MHLESEQPQNQPKLSIPKWEPKRRMTVMAVIVATIGSFGLGMTLVWSAIALKYIKEGKEFGEISEGQESLIGSIIYLGALISAPLTGFLITRLGRKTTMVFHALPCLFGWLLIAFAQKLWFIYLGRFVTGFCGGAFTVAVPTYVSEITEDRIRGKLGTVFILMLVCGIEFTFVVGAFVSWSTLSFVAACISVLQFSFMLFMPESPRFLVIQRRPTQARLALKWLRRASTKTHIEPEMSQIESSVASANSKSSKTSDLFTWSVLRPIGSSIALMGFSQFSGMNGIALYTSEVFEKAGTDMDPRFALIIVWGAQLLSVLLVTFFLVENFPRKALLLVSQGIMIVGLVAFGASKYIQVDGKVPEDLGWLPLTSLVTFIVGYNVGLGPLSWLVTSEILPPHVREHASSIVTLFYWALSFIAGITFIPLEGSFQHNLYWGCAGITLLSCLFIVFMIPETKGKGAEEIQRYFGASAAEIKRNSEKRGMEGSGGGVVNPSFEEVHAAL